MFSTAARKWVPLALALALTLSLAACGSDDDGTGATATTTGEETTTTVASEGGVVNVVAVEYGFGGIDATLPAGETEFTFTNDGEEPHEMTLIPLTEDAPPLDELIKGSEKEASKYFAGKPEHTDAKAGEEGKSITVDLKPGVYAYVCFVSTKQSEKPHAFLGMRGTFEVQ